MEAERIYALRRSTVMLNRPNGRQGKALGLVYEGQLVIVKARRGKWTQVEWLNRREGKAALGWVRKKYLERAQ